jgi:hypothetical protein
VEASNSCVGTLIFGSFFFIVFCQSFFSVPFHFFWLSVLLSFLFLSNWFLFLSSFVFPVLFQHCFILVSLAHVVSSLAYPNLLGTKRLGCCCRMVRAYFFNLCTCPIQTIPCLCSELAQLQGTYILQGLCKTYFFQFFKIFLHRFFNILLNTQISRGLRSKGYAPGILH